MRTKTLLIASAALAAGILASSAQTYSQNIVGYVNQKLVGNQYNMIANPLTSGANTADLVFNGSGNPAFTGYMPDGTTLLVWNGASFDAYTYDTSVGADDNNWYNGDESDTAPTPVIGVGEGFFVRPTSSWTWTETLTSN